MKLLCTNVLLTLFFTLDTSYKNHTVYQLSPFAAFFAVFVSLLTQFTQKKSLKFKLI